MTYAVHRIWVGVWREELTGEQIEKIEAYIGLLKISVNPGFPIQEISMHGKTIGYGALVHELDWITTEERPEIFESCKYERAIEGAQAHLEYLFEKLRLPLKIHPYHHIDLGG